MSQDLRVTSDLQPSSPPHSENKVHNATKSSGTYQVLDTLLLDNVFNFILICMCFSNILTNFVQFFTANESYNSFGQSDTAHWWTLKVTKNMSTVRAHSYLSLTHNISMKPVSLNLNFMRAKWFILKNASKFAKTLFSTVEIAIFKSPAQQNLGNL